MSLPVRVILTWSARRTVPALLAYLFLCLPAANAASARPTASPSPSGSSRARMVYDSAPQKVFTTAGRGHLSWADCGSNGVRMQTFACNSNTGGAYHLIGSFVAPAGITNFSGFTAIVRIRPIDGKVPDWWKISSVYYCRPDAGLQPSFVLSSLTCPEPYHIQAAGGMIYNYVSGAGLEYGEVQVAGRAADDTGVPLTEGTEYGAFDLIVTRVKTTSCSGCSQPMRLTLDAMNLYGPTHTLLTSLDASDSVLWQNPSTSGVDAPGGAPLAFTSVSWQPDGRAGTVGFTSPRPSAASLELYDVSGRRWARQRLATVPGANSVHITSPKPLGSGVYFVRLEQDGTDVSRRLLVMR